MKLCASYLTLSDISPPMTVKILIAMLDVDPTRLEEEKEEEKECKWCVFSSHLMLVNLVVESTLLQ